VLSLLQNLVGQLPQEGEINLTTLAKKLSGRPLSDVAFVVREGARIAARSGKDKLNQESLVKALDASPAREEDGGHRKIGFV